MSCCMICSDNMVDSTLLNALTYSSQDADFPATNVQDNVRAYRTWRSGGYYVVTASNKTIIFRDSAGVDLTATIAEGTYTTTATFLTAVDTALEAAGAASYTVTQDDTSFKFVFTSDLSGGATAFQIRADDVLCTARTILGLGTAAYTGASTYTADLICLHTEEWLVFDFGTPTEIEAAIVLGKAREVWSLSESATITLEINETTNWTSPEYSEVLSRTDFGAYTMDEEGLFEARRYARIKITDPTNEFGYVEISKVFLGEMVQLVQGSAQFGFVDGIDDLTVTIDSIGGVTSANAYPIRSVVTYQLDFMTNADKENVQDVYLKYGKEKPLFFIFDDNETLGVVPERMVKLMRFIEPPQFTKISPQQWACTFRLKEEL